MSDPKPEVPVVADAEVELDELVITEPPAVRTDVDPADLPAA